MAGVVLAGLTLGLWAAAPGRADAPVVTVGTHSLIMKDSVVYPGSRKFSFNVRSAEAPEAHRISVPPPDGPGDPRWFGGALVVYNGSGTGEAFTIDLPAEQWRLYGSTVNDWRYVYSAGSPVWKVYVKRYKVSVRGGKALWGYTLDEPSQGTLAVRLTLGSSVTWCSVAEPQTSGSPPSSAAYDLPNKFKARRLQSAPAACPALPAAP
jgi:hypothetical protein